jgi:hypothetical protein
MQREKAAQSVRAKTEIVAGFLFGESAAPRSTKSWNSLSRDRLKRRAHRVPRGCQKTCRGADLLPLANCDLSLRERIPTAEPRVG